MLLAAALDVGYDPVADRIVVAARGQMARGGFEPGGGGAESVTLLLTRRIVRRILSGISDIMKRSSMAVSRAPAGQRDEVLVLEHLGALAARPGHAGGTAVAASPRASAGSVTIRETRPVPGRLVVKIDLRITTRHFVIRLYDGEGPRVEVLATRADLHRLLDRMMRVAAEAEWALDRDAGWLAARAQLAGRRRGDMAS